MQFSSWTIEEKLNNANHLNTQEEQICHILLSLEELRIGERLLFFRFSPVGYVGEGVAQIENGQLQSISFIRDDIRSLPIIKNVVEKRKAAYYSGQEIITLITSKYIQSAPLQALIVVPVFANSITIAYICCEITNNTVPIDSEKLEHLTLFGRLAGELLVRPQLNTHPKLSPRENEVLIALANGLSTKELTTLLSLSEATIKQYIKSSVIKLGAKNRTHAVSIFLAQVI